MDKEKMFNEFAGECFNIIHDQGYFDLEANYSSNQKSVIIIMHKMHYRYRVTLRTEKGSIWDTDVQLAFWIALENMESMDVADKTFLLDDIISTFEVSGFKNVKTLNPKDSFTLVGTFEGNKIVVKCSVEDITEQLIVAKENALCTAMKTGVYKALNPKYQINDRKLREHAFENQDFDSMDGHEFEKFCAALLEKNGYRNVKVTKGSGDQGIDVLAERFGQKYGFQCKRFSSDVGNKAIMEVYSGIAYYKCDIGIVITNQQYTKAAKELAKRIGIILWSRTDLLRLIEK